MWVARLVLACAGPVGEAIPTGEPGPTTESTVGPTDTNTRPPDTGTTEPPPGLSVEAGSPTSLGTTGFGANGTVYPRGEPASYWFEYGPDSSYGLRTPVRSVGPARTAFYTESWDDGLGGWRGGSGDGLVFRAAGGKSGGFVRYGQPTATDYNHVDGVGLLHLVQYFYPGEFPIAYPPTASLGGGRPDFRDAEVRLWLRGTDWNDYTYWLAPSQTPAFRGDELAFWAQVDASAAGDMSSMSNWAHTGHFLTGALYGGDWTEVAYTLRVDTNAWSYAGQNRAQRRDLYVYHPLVEVLSHLNVNFFHLLMFVDDTIEMGGAIDFDELTITYRNHSALIASNRGTLTSWPPEGDDPATLTDGHRFGEGRSWLSGPDPVGPLEFQWSLARPIAVERVMVHNHAEWPSRTVGVNVSEDGVTWTSVLAGDLPAGSPEGPNFDHLLVKGLGVTANHIRVRVLDGYRPEFWGLGEVEVFGTGATQRTDEAGATVAEDITGFAPGDAVHYRLVAETHDETAYGPDQVYAVPTGEVPEVRTGAATVIDATRVRIEGVINTLGGEGWYAFDVGSDPMAYSLRTTAVWTGAEITPRTFSRVLDLAHPDLAHLTSGTEVHYRIALCDGCEDASGSTWLTGADATFVVP